MDPWRLFVPHLHTHRRTHTCALIARPLHCAVDAVTMQSPMQFRAIQVRLALCTSDTVTVYPSPTHTRTNASRKHRRRESHECERWCTWVGGGRCSCGCNPHVIRAAPTRGRGCEAAAATFAFVPQESDCSSRDPRQKLRGRRPEQPPESGVFTASESRPSGDKTAHNSAPEGYRELRGFWQNLLT